MSTPSRLTALAAPEPVPELDFRVEGVEPQPFAAAPMLRFRLAIERVGGGRVRSIAVNAQVRIAAPRRPYGPGEQERLLEVFGPPADWGRSLGSLLWTLAAIHVPPFEDRTEVDLLVPCTYDFEVASTKYLNALEGGDVPLELLFSGTVFYADARGQLRTTRISWEKEAEYWMPVSVWRATMDHYFPGTAWLRLRRETFDRLAAFKARHTLPTWESTIDALLADAEPPPEGEP